MTQIYGVYVNGVDKSGPLEWNFSCEEVLGGIGRTTIIVQDRTLTWEPQVHDDVKVTILATGWVLFRGEVITEPVELPVGEVWRRWKLDCSDYNYELDWRLVGALDGTLFNNWVDIDGFGDYVLMDHYAQSLASDRETVIQLFDHYIRVAGEAFDTATYVGEYLVGSPTIYWTYTTLRAALDDLASQIVVNLQYWADPDLKVHWTAIPSWQELSQEVGDVLVGGSPTAPLARMMPEFPVGTLSTAPADNITDVPDDGNLGCRELKFTFDGSSMPEQVYIKGSTGFVYNNGIDPFAPISDPVPPAPIYPGQYLLTFNAPTLVFSRHSTGYIAEPGTSYGTAGEQVYVNPIRVPLDPVHQTGGSFYMMKTGGKPGWLVSFWSNSLEYGDITVVPVPVPELPPDVPPPTPVPTIGVGGSGWANSVAQDPNKRQAYFDAEISADQSTRDSVGNQILYRGAYPTLRGSMKVSGGYDADLGQLGPDGWRVGQLVRIVDARLPAILNGRYFIIQRVQTGAIASTDVREYTIDWGDGPTSRYSAQAPKKEPLPPPAVQVLVDVPDLAPEPNTTQVVVGQLANAIGFAWAISDKIVNWSLLVFDLAGNQITGQGTLDPQQSMTDREGKARTTLTTGSETGLVYFVYAEVPVT